MSRTLPGLHHVTAITSDAQRNVDFYCGALGLRLVKLTVNFDDPGSYHLYYGDELGRPGTIMTFFAWPGAPRGRAGPPQVTATSFSVPRASLDFWAGRLKEHGVTVEPPVERLGDRALHFTDPDGMGLDLVGLERPAGEPWRAGPLPVEHAIRGFHGVTISEEGYERTAAVLTSLMGFEEDGREGNRFRYRAGGGGEGPGRFVDLVCVPDARHGDLGAGIVHHVAFRTPDDDQQRAWRSAVAGAGLNVSPVMDRSYFHSIYFREPSGVLFEIADDAPGFTVDVPLEQLGSVVILPPRLEPHRKDIERRLTPLPDPRAGWARTPGG